VSLLSGSLNGFVIMIAQAGPTELFVPEGSQVQSRGGIEWLVWAGLIVLVLGVGVWMRAMGQRRVDPRELAFRSLAKKIGLSHSQASAIRAMGASSGQSPVGLLMSPSAVRATAESA
tara:strand:+ start:64156 stop:64506 length:351 start_codon:yes stop_codon:yes gene_type:complete